MRKTVEIEIDKYFDLSLSELKLNLLEMGGVDNWTWYGESLYSDESDDRNLNKLEEKLKLEIYGENK